MGGVIASLLLASALVFSGCSSGSDSESSGGGGTSATAGGTSGGTSGGESGGGSGGGSGVSLSTPLTLKALTEGTIVVTSPKDGMQYSLNGGAKTAVTSEAITVAAGDTVAFYGSGTSITSYNGTKIAGGTAQVKAYGNIMSLVNEEGFATATELAENAFYRLFNGNANLKDASGLLLPATTLAQSCYSDMFFGCYSLTAAPALPATTLAQNCYYFMFKGCISLTAAPALPATSLAELCYGYMFDGCISLTAAPALPATTLAQNCYYNMFYGCSSLNAVTCLANDVSANGCTNNWLNGVAANGTFTTPSSTNWNSGVDGIPDGWTRVDAN